MPSLFKRPVYLLLGKKEDISTLIIQYFILKKKVNNKFLNTNIL